MTYVVFYTMANSADDCSQKQHEKLPSIKQPEVSAYSMTHRVTRIRNSLESTVGTEKMPVTIQTIKQVIVANQFSSIRK